MDSDAMSTLQLLEKIKIRTDIEFWNSNAITHDKSTIITHKIQLKKIKTENVTKIDQMHREKK